MASAQASAKDMCINKLLQSADALKTLKATFFNVADAATSFINL